MIERNKIFRILKMITLLESGHKKRFPPYFDVYEEIEREFCETESSIMVE